MDCDFVLLHSQPPVSPSLANTSALRTARIKEGVPAMLLSVSVVTLQLVFTFAMSRTEASVCPTSVRSKKYGSGRLIQVFHDIRHIFSYLPLLHLDAERCSTPPPNRVLLSWGGFKAERRILFRRRQKWFASERCRIPLARI